MIDCGARGRDRQHVGLAALIGEGGRELRVGIGEVPVARGQAARGVLDVHLPAREWRSLAVLAVVGDDRSVGRGVLGRTERDAADAVAPDRRAEELHGVGGVAAGQHPAALLAGGVVRERRGDHAELCRPGGPVVVDATAVAGLVAVDHAVLDRHRPEVGDPAAGRRVAAGDAREHDADRRARSHEEVAAVAGDRCAARKGQVGDRHVDDACDLEHTRLARGLHSRQASAGAGDGDVVLQRQLPGRERVGPGGEHDRVRVGVLRGREHGVAQGRALEQAGLHLPTAPLWVVRVPEARDGVRGAQRGRSPEQAGDDYRDEHRRAHRTPTLTSHRSFTQLSSALSTTAP